MDLANTIGPVLSPPTIPRGLVIYTICLDPGHGGKDPGEHSGWNEEKKFTLLLAQEAAAQLRAAGFKVFLTPTVDTYLELSTRTEIARRNGSGFVSLFAFELD